MKYPVPVGQALASCSKHIQHLLGSQHIMEAELYWDQLLQELGKSGLFRVNIPVL